MAIKVIVIDAEADYRSLLSHHITTRWQDAKVTEINPGETGRLSDGFAGAGSDLVLLGHPLGSESGLDWLHQFRHVKGFPPVVIIGDGDERSIVTAMRQGAADYISRTRLNHTTLVTLLEGVLADRNLTDAESSQTRLPVSDLDIPGLRGFFIERCISGGDIASVYLARKADSGESVVLKVLRQVPDFGGGDTALDRFLIEFEVIRRLSHPNIVRIFDLGVADNHAYIAMEYCSRGSLKARIMAGLQPAQAEVYMRCIAHALSAIHDVGILHRDLKPTNVLFREDETLALIDFGLAKQAHLKAELTGAGEIFGTPYYMSPEQGHGEPLDRRSDIYSLGVIFYEMLTGTKPYEARTAMSVILKHAQEPIPRLPPHLANYQSGIDRMLAKRPGHRFQTVEELLSWQPLPV